MRFDAQRYFGSDKRAQEDFAKMDKADQQKLAAIIMANGSRRGGHSEVTMPPTHGSRKHPW